VTLERRCSPDPMSEVPRFAESEPAELESASAPMMGGTHRGPGFWNSSNVDSMTPAPARSSRSRTSSRGTRCDATSAGGTSTSGSRDEARVSLDSSGGTAARTHAGRYPRAATL
jgi:hypothetical protein